MEVFVGCWLWTKGCIKFNLIKLECRKRLIKIKLAMKNLLFFVATAMVATLSYGQIDVFINEIHYDNIGGDADEGIEIAGPAGTDLSGWSLELYNGDNSLVYATINLTGTIPNQRTLWFPIINIQNDMEGLALIDPLNNLVQFLSYEGGFTAASGVAAGLTSTNINVEESDITTVIGHSLQLTGTGSNYGDFTWGSPAIATRNLLNNGQIFSITPSILKNAYSIVGLDYEVGSTSSIEGSFNVEGSNLDFDIVITAPTNFEVSETSGGGFSSSVSLLKGTGTISPTTIYVRLKAGLSIGNYIQDILIQSSGAVDKIIRLTGNVSPNSGSIIITEILQDPSGVTDANGEYFEVYNTTASDIDLKGWIISDGGSNSHTIASSVIVHNDGYAVLARNADILANGGFTASYDYSGITLGNGTDAIILTSGVTEIDRVAYDAVNFPYFAGKSMELHLYKYDAVSNNNGSNWGSAISTYGSGDFGTPGSNNDFGLSIVKNEIEDFAMYPNPANKGELHLTSQNRTEKQVEIYAWTGQLVYSKEVGYRETMNISNLNKGIYMVRIAEEGKVATRKLVVN